MTYTDQVLVLTDVTKRFGAHTVLDGVSWRVGPGITALLGPNGAGKTTLVRIVSTLERLDGGSLSVLGHDVARERRTVQQLIGLTGQHTAVDGMLSGTENLVMVGRLLGLSRLDARRRAGELLAQFDLADAARRRAGTYSGGMRRRLDLAMSLVRAPRVLLLDEPTTGLDPRSRRALWEQVRRLTDDGTAVLLTTQYLEEADALADRIAVLDSGRLVAEGTAAELKAGAGGDVVEVLDEHGQPSDTLTTDGTAGHVASVLRSLPGSARVQVRRPTLDEVVLQLTGKEAA
ncbi:ATP-binding cassette domain-containing protein [Desertihabitans brevis]|uniref:ATP-binding cassette domain-containing protein n=1 Tax=Desertihabitans brevis TaxID=2268447 RepID=A0A367YRM3_9ACTN|nr:ATP-binding cassette domain-containing protein [Desertihabitans brevis]RCK68484.1 ATP-binding cassette domain-containing protein [Desertihabitans brevis]